MGVLALVCPLWGACTGSPEHKEIEPQYDPQTGRLQLLRYDSNGNGKVDTISYMDGSRILRIEIDKNEDGRIDRWEYYDAQQMLVKIGFSQSDTGKEDAWSYSAADGTPVRLDISTHGDGKVTRTEFYEKGAIVSAEEDSNGDGVIDKWEMYGNAGSESRLMSVAFDTRHRGRPDRRLTYDANGAVRVEVDPGGDGGSVLP